MKYVTQNPSITHAAARAIIDAAVEAAGETSIAYAIAVVDAAGHLTAFIRMDGAPVMAAQVAQDKAYTAAGFGMSTEQWHEFIKDDAPLALGAPTGVDRLVAFGGGIPITVDGHIVGGIGVSGGHWSDDIKIAGAGMTAIN
ncbi:heme-binding protein [Nonomuraea sp. NEAU-A123]|uniref:GlcG/HbpS family heme-binding protein n=1 Tax=Nonomuraea sp. NEAU-A123 TaxID=2839649 RepID=UPI001BE457E5|nr:heme-binding protein [Nonomuraea sp. NEAU-A123]MBT2234233.1 heme-binding protein [Nonomuraea sp. NEAU-A123]